MKPNEVQIQLERLFRTPIEHPDSSKTAPIAISDLFVQIDPAAGEVQLFNDKDEELHRVVIYDWIQEGRTEIPSAMRSFVLQSKGCMQPDSSTKTNLYAPSRWL